MQPDSMTESAAFTLYVVRHGETEHNRRRLMQGRRIDASLNDRGQRQAALLGERFREVALDAVWVSPLLRARQTADAVLSHHPGVPVVIEPDLAEMSWGEMEGLSIDDVAEDLRAFAAEWRDGRFDRRVGGGESIRDVEIRARAVVDRLLERHRGETVLAVTHGRYLRVFLAAALDRGGLRTMDRFQHANTGVYRLVHDGTAFVADLENCTAHLEAELATP